MNITNGEDMTLPPNPFKRETGEDGGEGGEGRRGVEGRKRGGQVGGNREKRRENKDSRVDRRPTGRCYQPANKLVCLYVCYKGVITLFSIVIN